jgi:hypothetical protein
MGLTLKVSPIGENAVRTGFFQRRPTMKAAILGIMVIIFYSILPNVVPPS